MPPTSPQQRFGVLLKQLREATGLTQAEAAEKVAVSRANFAQWETGKHLPAGWRIEKLDEELAAKGALIAAAAAVRPLEGPRPVARDERRTKSLLELWPDVRAALIGRLIDDQDPPGWRHNLEPPNSEPPSMLSTSYGLKAMAMLGDPHPSMPRLVDTVMRSATLDPKGRIVGWAARTQPAPTMETTSTALDALLRAGAPIAADEVVRILNARLDDTARQRPFILTCALEPLLAVAPDSDLAGELIEALLACRVENGLWPEKRDASIEQPGLRPSVAHTARAITILRKAPGERAREAVAAAEPWIADTTSLDGVAEIIRRTEPTYSELTIQHFTAAWVVRATAGNADLRSALRRALDYVWDRFDHAVNLWKMDNGDAPVWMLTDAVVALHDASLAMFATPVDRDVG